METILTVAGIVGVVACVGLAFHAFATDHPGQGALWLIAAPVAFFVTAMVVGLIIVGAMIGGILWLMDQG